MALPPEQWAGLAAALAMVAIAVFLALVGKGRACRAFALLLAVRGIGGASAGLATASDPWSGVFARAFPYFFIAIPFACLWFLAVYPRPRRGWSSPAGAALLLAGALVMELLYLRDHRLFATVAGLGAPGASGPFEIVLPVFNALFVVIALVAGLEGLRATGSRRTSMLLVSVGFALMPAFSATVSVLRPTNVLDESLSAAGTALRYASLAGCAVLAGLFARAAQQPEARGPRRAFAAVVLALLAGLVVGALPADAAGGVLAPLGNGLARLILAVLVAYGLLRHQLLDVDLKVKWTIKQSTVAAAFVGVFFIVSESASTFFAGSVGPYVGIAAAGLLVFALAPLQRLGDRVSDAALPGVRPVRDLASADRLRLYREHLQVAWQDGQLSKEERRLLEVARRQLGVSEHEAARLEREVTGA